MTDESETKFFIYFCGPFSYGKGGQTAAARFLRKKKEKRNLVSFLSYTPPRMKRNARAEQHSKDHFGVFVHFRFCASFYETAM